MSSPSVETCIAQLLRNVANIVDLVDTRIHLQNRPQGEALPSIVIRLQEYGDDPDIDNDETHINSRIAVDCYAASYNEAYLLDQMIRGTDADPCLTQHTGTVTCYGADNVTVYGTRNIDAIVAEDTTTDAGDPPDASDQRTYYRSTLFFVLASK